MSAVLDGAEVDDDDGAACIAESAAGGRREGGEDVDGTPGGAEPLAGNFPRSRAWRRS